MNRIILAAVGLLACMGVAFAQNQPVIQGKRQAAGYCYLTSLGSATGLTGFTNGPGSSVCNGASQAALNQYTYAVICAYVANVNWLDSGTPTGSVPSGGQQLAAGSCIPYSGPLGSIQFIQQSAGAVVGAMVYY